MQITTWTGDVCDSYVYPYVGQSHSSHALGVRNLITFISLLQNAIRMAFHLWADSGPRLLLTGVGLLCYVYTMSPATTAVTISATVDETG